LEFVGLGVGGGARIAGTSEQAAGLVDDRH
jgi:hypothetical protein